MKTNLSVANPAEVETECLVAVALDRGTKEKSEMLRVQIGVTIGFFSTNSTI